MKLKLTKAKVNHLLGLLEINDREGYYYGNKEHYLKRHNELKTDLKLLLSDSSLKLEEKHKTDFDEWLKNRFIRKGDYFFHSIGGFNVSVSEVLEMYRKEVLNL